MDTGSQPRAWRGAQPEGGSLPEGVPERRWSLARVGWLLLPLAAPWTLLALLLPSPVGVYFPADPLLILLTLIALFIFGFGLLRAPKRWTPAFRRTAVLSLAFGLLLPAMLGGWALADGCPVLGPLTTSEPGGWERISGPAWNGASGPYLFFYGSVACPYCSASSWAVLGALERLGNVSHLTFDHSSSSDSFANTPSVVLPDLAVTSRYVTPNLHEALSDSSIEAPALDSCSERAYVSAFNPLGGVPFLVVGGAFFHTQTLVDPGALSGLSANQLASQVANGSGSAWSAIAPALDALLAYVVYEDGGQPSSVAQLPGVASVLSGIR